MRFDETAYTSRLSRLRSLLLSREVQALVLFDMHNIRYLTGFTGSDGALVVRPQSATLLVDGRYLTQAREEVRVADSLLYQDKVDGIEAALDLKAGETAGFEAAAVSYEFYSKWADRLGGERLKPLTEGLSSIRAVKDADEVSCMRRAAELAGRILGAVSSTISEGVSERDIALEIEYQAKKAGAEKMAFETIVASGANAALPHAKPGAKMLEQGDPVVIDYGVVVDGYCSDETCTFWVGFADGRKREVYGAVKEAHDRAVEAVRAGVACSTIDRVARGILENYGLGAWFSHGTGHGVGLEVHEAPRISAKSDAILSAGMVITIEPGVYLPGQWGVRIEDTVLVRDDGCEVLTKVPKDLIIL